MKIGVVILAGGLSTRMGAFKPLLRIGGKSLLTRCIECMKAAHVYDIVVVTGHNHTVIKEEVEQHSVRCVYNSHYLEGMFSSVRVGVKALRHCRAFFVLPVDIPLIRPKTLKTLCKNYDDSILYPEYYKQCGHPPLIPEKLRQPILKANGDGGLAAVLALYPSKNIPVWDRFILRDADTPDNFATLSHAFIDYDILVPKEAEEIARQMMPEKIQVHGQLVAKIALALAQGLRQTERALNHNLLYSSALLHDICKGSRHHEKKGEELLLSFGLQRIAEIVGSHCDMAPPKDKIFHEKELVYLADKLVKGRHRIDLSERFREKLEIYKKNKDACRNIRHRRNNTERLAALWEEQSGIKIEKWLKKNNLGRTQ